VVVFGDVGAKGGLVSRTRRGAISAFTRVFDALWCCDAEPGPSSFFCVDGWAPALQRTAEVALRCVRGTKMPVIPGRPQGEPGIHFSADDAARWIPGLRAAPASRNDGGCG